MLKIDIVYTWVDGSDESWLIRKQEAQKRYANKNLAIFSTVNGRFRNSNEIIYSIRSIEKYFPEHGNIFIVTDRQKVKGLDETKVIYVDHKEIMDYKPTYSSKKIESNLFKIRGLSENFMAFNDDVLLGPKFSISDFYDNEKYCLHFEKEEESEDKFPPEIKLNSLKAIEKNYPGYEKKHIDRNFKHNPRLINKELFKLFIKDVYVEYNNLQDEVFRSKDTLSLISDTYFRWLHAKGLAVEKNVDYVYVNCKNKIEDFNDLINQFDRLSYFCINDVTDDNYSLDYKLDTTQEVLSKIFPEKSEYEV